MLNTSVFFFSRNTSSVSVNQLLLLDYFLHSRMLGALSDGIVSQEKLIETKCPFSRRDTGVTAAVGEHNSYLK